MLQELFITYCTNSTSIMNPFTLIKKWNASFKSRTDNVSHLELPNTENISLSKGYAKLFFAILTF